MFKSLVTHFLAPGVCVCPPSHSYVEDRLPRSRNRLYTKKIKSRTAMVLLTGLCFSKDNLCDQALKLVKVRPDKELVHLFGCKALRLLDLPP